MSLPLALLQKLSVDDDIDFIKGLFTLNDFYKNDFSDFGYDTVFELVDQYLSSNTPNPLIDQALTNANIELDQLREHWQKLSKNLKQDLPKELRPLLLPFSDLASESNNNKPEGRISWVLLDNQNHINTPGTSLNLSYKLASQLFFDASPAAILEIGMTGGISTSAELEVPINIGSIGTSAELSANLRSIFYFKHLKSSYYGHSLLEDLKQLPSPLSLSNLQKSFKSSAHLHEIILSTDRSLQLSGSAKLGKMVSLASDQATASIGVHLGYKKNWSGQFQIILSSDKSNETESPKNIRIRIDQVKSSLSEAKIGVGIELDTKEIALSAANVVNDNLGEIKALIDNLKQHVNINDNVNQATTESIKQLKLDIITFLKQQNNQNQWVKAINNTGFNVSTLTNNVDDNANKLVEPVIKILARISQQVEMVAGALELASKETINIAYEQSRSISSNNKTMLEIEVDIDADIHVAEAYQDIFLGKFDNIIKLGLDNNNKQIQLLSGSLLKQVTDEKKAGFSVVILNNLLSNTSILRSDIMVQVDLMTGNLVLGSQSEVLKKNYAFGEEHQASLLVSSITSLTGGKQNNTTSLATGVAYIDKNVNPNEITDFIEILAECNLIRKNDANLAVQRFSEEYSEYNNPVVRLDAGLNLTPDQLKNLINKNVGSYNSPKTLNTLSEAMLICQHPDLNEDDCISGPANLMKLDQFDDVPSFMQYLVYGEFQSKLRNHLEEGKNIIGKPYDISSISTKRYRRNLLKAFTWYGHYASKFDDLAEGLNTLKKIYNYEVSEDYKQDLNALQTLSNNMNKQLGEWVFSGNFVQQLFGKKFAKTTLVLMVVLAKLSGQWKNVNNASLLTLKMEIYDQQKKSIVKLV